MQRISDLRKSLHNDHEAAMCELLDKLDVKSKKLKKLENQMCSLEELDGLRETEKSHKRLMQSYESIIKVFIKLKAIFEMGRAIYNRFPRKITDCQSKMKK